jgi:hypothetical protein
MPRLSDQEERNEHREILCEDVKRFRVSVGQLERYIQSDSISDAHGLAKDLQNRLNNLVHSIGTHESLFYRNRHG